MATKAEREHMGRVAQLGCVVCIRLHGPHDPGMAEIHHPRSGVGKGQRSSHMDVIPLCVDHHRGNLGIHGLGTKGFAKHYGFNEHDLLDDVNRLLL